MSSTTPTPPTPPQRRAHAHRLLDPSSDHPGRVRLRVQCARSHHVAEVHDVDGTLVYLSWPGPRGHGRRDRVDTAHKGDAARAWADVLETGPDALDDDELPARCECGPRTLSRRALLAAVRDHQRRLRVS
ncbi:hypothetical protein [Actinomycetospora cinnamomea]|uniref:Uncharacterized protein n=1 Tax=Actinomycetospora cinnamomea TaxID=663609 RepID=A0A2U1F0W5_9PSEU|nr:hypothetical protein [Actinomycetospora cinnamomea]PVZ05833.1 hypothetical protein C8D89_11489 [Actinomycetospora cinnamomea]